jgi:hypothetical protein
MQKESTMGSWEKTSAERPPALKRRVAKAPGNDGPTIGLFSGKTLDRPVKDA